MNIKQLVSEFKSHPVLFIGTGMTKRYLKKAYTWPELLSSIMQEIEGTDEGFLSMLDKYNHDYLKIGNEIENIFNTYMDNNREGLYKAINDEYFASLRTTGIALNRFKLLIADKLNRMDFLEDKKEEIDAFKELSSNIKSIITTNYDHMLESLFELNTVIGNNLHMTSQYGALYKIHGCVSKPNSIIITSDDYNNFKEKDDLIRAQLISLFLYNPVIFLGYGSNDPNIERTIETIYKYIDDIDIMRNIQSNFLIVNFVEGSNNMNVTTHDKSINGTIISVNELKTDNYIALYKAIQETPFAAEAGALKLLQDLWNRTIVEDISKSTQKIVYIGGVDKTKMSDYVICAIDRNQISSVDEMVNKITFSKPKNLVDKYWELIEGDENNRPQINDKIEIGSKEYFPIYGFEACGYGILNLQELKNQQNERILNIEKQLSDAMTKFYSLHSIKRDYNILDVQNSELPPTWKDVLIINFAVSCNDVQVIKEFLINNPSINSTMKRKLLCIYDKKKYG